MCGFLGIDLFGTKAAAKKQAAATLKAAEMTAADDREAARGATLAMQTQLAQKKASDAAAELLGQPQEGATVILAPQEERGNVDPTTGRRRTARNAFFRPNTVGASI